MCSGRFCRPPQHQTQRRGAVAFQMRHTRQRSRRIRRNLRDHRRRVTCTALHKAQKRPRRIRSQAACMPWSTTKSGIRIRGKIQQHFRHGLIPLLGAGWISTQSGPARAALRSCFDGGSNLYFELRICFMISFESRASQGCRPASNSYIVMPKEKIWDGIKPAPLVFDLFRRHVRARAATFANPPRAPA